MGPEGRGPMTGKRMGYCAGHNVAGSAGRGMGHGHGAGRGMGRGMRCRSGTYHGRAGYAPMSVYTPTPEDEKRHLEEFAKQMKADLESVEERIQKLNESEETEE